LDIIIEDDVAKVADRSCFAGSIASGDRLLRNMTRLAGVPLHEAVRMMTVNPAKAMGIDDRKGSLKTGMDADIIMFDENLNVLRVMVMGRCL
jgi:N-acetylglucosamine-6-phosphate deacetylase